MDVVLLVLIFVVATLYSSVGHGGSSGYQAVMALMEVEPAVMRPIALSLNILVAGISFTQFARTGGFSWRLFWPFAVASIPASFVGGHLPVAASLFRPLVGVVLIFSAVRLLTPAHADDDQPRTAPSIPLSLSLGAVIGLLSGLTGTGGGIFLTPLILLMRWTSTRVAAGVSAAFVAVNSVAGLAGQFAQGQKPPRGIWMYAGAALVGALLGAYVGSRKFHPATIKRVLAVVLLSASVKLLLSVLCCVLWFSGSDLPRNC